MKQRAMINGTTTQAYSCPCGRFREDGSASGRRPISEAQARRDYQAHLAL